MPSKTFMWKDFGAGWCPSDDAINGRKNALLKMDNLELDRNGRLTLAGGTNVISTFGDSSAHSLDSRILNGTRHDYTSLATGKIYRDSTLIFSNGSTSITAFGDAYKYVLLASDNFRVKDDGTNFVNLGILPPTAAPTITALIYKTTPISLISDLTDYSHGSVTIVATGGYRYLTSFQVNADFTFIYQAVLGSTVYNFDVLTQNTVGTTTTAGNDNDFFILQFFGLDGGGNPTVNTSALGNILNCELQIFSSPPGGSLQASANYFTYSWNKQIPVNGDDVRQVTDSGILLAPRRAQFRPVGNPNWNHIIGWALLIQTAADTPDPIGIYLPQQFQGGNAGQLNGNIQYAQINVNNQGSYVGRSILGPIGLLAGAVNSGAAIKCQDPTIIDPQCNEAWIFRRDGGLNQWFRVLVFNVATGFGGYQIDTLSNEDAITLDITLNLNLISTASSGITEPILNIIGPMEGRWFFFTPSFIYPSDINDPDLVDPTLAIKTSNNSNEIFLWARKISEGVILVGTSNEVYVLNGTFTTLADGTVDVFYRPLTVKYPPISRDATFYDGRIFYLSNSGWRAINSSGQVAFTGSGGNPLLVAPNTDVLYRGISAYGYPTPNLLSNLPGDTRYPIIAGKNKLFCGITGTNRIEVWDFVREYWRPVTYDLGDINAITVTQEGRILGYFSDNKLREIDFEGNKLIDGTLRQTAEILSVAQDGDLPRNRKDLFTLKGRFFSGPVVNDGVINSLITDKGTYLVGPVTAMVEDSEHSQDLLELPIPPIRWWQFSSQTVASDFNLQDLSIDCDVRPAPLTSYKKYSTNFGTASKKRVRTLSFMIDTQGGLAVFTPTVDDIPFPPLNVVTPPDGDSHTINYQFLTDAFGVDYGYTINWRGGVDAPGFEFWGDMDPQIVQVLPVARRFDQVGPQEMFRYGKLQKLELRVLPFGCLIPYAIYIDDIKEFTSFIVTQPDVEQTYYANLQKGIAGGVVRIEFGPTTFDFHRFYARLLITPSGGQDNTEGQWVTLG